MTSPEGQREERSRRVAGALRELELRARGTVRMQPLRGPRQGETPQPPSPPARQSPAGPPIGQTQPKDRKQGSPHKSKPLQGRGQGKEGEQGTGVRERVAIRGPNGWRTPLTHSHLHTTAEPQAQHTEVGLGTHLSSLRPLDCILPSPSAQAGCIVGGLAAKGKLGCPPWPYPRPLRKREDKGGFSS